MHVGHININQQKMSKSLNNFILVKDILKEYETNTLRWFMCQTNYRNPLDYNHQIMQTCQIEINRFRTLVNTCRTYLLGHQISLKPSVVNTEFMQHLNNDLNISNALTTLYDLTKKMNVTLRNQKYDELALMLAEFIGSLEILGIEFVNIHEHAEHQKMISEYFLCLKNKDYQQSDILRSALIEKGLL